MNDEKYHDILLKEYAEAATLCRNFEQLTTVLPTLFALFAAALGGLLLNASANANTKYFLCSAGFAMGLYLAINVCRLQGNYLWCRKRIKEIEGLVKRDEQPVMSLYTGAPHTISHKLAILPVFWLFMAFFAAVAIVTVVGEGAIFEAPDTVSGTGTIAPPPPSR
jgi:hypothetical protein